MCSHLPGPCARLPPGATCPVPARDSGMKRMLQKSLVWKRTWQKCEEENEEERDLVTAASLRPCSSPPWARASWALSVRQSEPLLIHRHLSRPAGTHCGTGREAAALCTQAGRVKAWRFGRMQACAFRIKMGRTREISGCLAPPRNLSLRACHS